MNKPSDICGQYLTSSGPVKCIHAKAAQLLNVYYINIISPGDGMMRFI